MGLASVCVQKPPRGRGACVVGCCVGCPSEDYAAAPDAVKKHGSFKLCV